MRYAVPGGRFPRKCEGNGWEKQYGYGDVQPLRCRRADDHDAIAAPARERQWRIQLSACGDWGQPRYQWQSLFVVLVAGKRVEPASRSRAELGRSVERNAFPYRQLYVLSDRGGRCQRHGFSAIHAGRCVSTLDYAPLASSRNRRRVFQLYACGDRWESSIHVVDYERLAHWNYAQRGRGAERHAFTKRRLPDRVHRKGHLPRGPSHCDQRRHYSSHCATVHHHDRIASPAGEHQCRIQLSAYGDQRKRALHMDMVTSEPFEYACWLNSERRWSGERHAFASRRLYRFRHGQGRSQQRGVEERHVAHRRATRHFDARMSIGNRQRLL